MVLPRKECPACKKKTIAMLMKKPISFWGMDDRMLCPKCYEESMVKLEAISSDYLKLDAARRVFHLGHETLQRAIDKNLIRHKVSYARTYLLISDIEKFIIDNSKLKYLKKDNIKSHESNKK